MNLTAARISLLLSLCSHFYPAVQAILRNGSFSLVRLLPGCCLIPMHRVVSAICAIQRQLRSVDKLKCFIVDEGKAAAVEDSTIRYFDSTENGRCCWEEMVKRSFGWARFFIGEGSLET